MSATLDQKLNERSESLSGGTPAEPHPALDLADSVAKKVADAVPSGIRETDSGTALAENEEVREGRRLLALFEALKKIPNREITESEYRLLLDYGCVYAQGGHVRRRIADELAWFEAKKAVLDEASGFFGFMKRMKLEWEPIANWFRMEYKSAFPDGTLSYGGWDHAQTADVVNRRITTLSDPEFGSVRHPQTTLRAKEWLDRLWGLVNEIRKRGTVGESSSLYSDLADAGGIWLPATVISAFALSGMSTPASEGGFSFWTDTDADGDGDSDGGSDGGGAD